MWQGQSCSCPEFGDQACTALPGSGRARRPCVRESERWRAGRYLLVLGFQFWMTVMGEVLASSGIELITKDWPSGATI